MDGNILSTILDVVAWVFLLSGSAIVIIGGIGMLRLPDVYARMHAAGMADTMGVLLIAVGQILQVDSWITAMKLVFIIAFMFFASPTATHALARATEDHGIKPVLGKKRKAARSSKKSLVKRTKKKKT